MRKVMYLGALLLLFCCWLGISFLFVSFGLFVFWSLGFLFVCLFLHFSAEETEQNLCLKSSNQNK